MEEVVSMTSKKAAEISCINNKDTLDLVLFQLGVLRRRRRVDESRLEERIAKIKAAPQERWKQEDSIRDKLLPMAQRYIDEHQVELFGDKKSFELTHALVKRSESTELVVEDEDSVIAALKHLKRDDLINVVESLLKSHLKDAPELIKHLPGVRRVRNVNETIVFKPGPNELASTQKGLEEKRKIPLPPND